MTISRATIKNNSQLEDFNRRDPLGFSAMYKQLYSSLYLYASSLYSTTTIDAADIIQDTFLHIWDKSELNFESISKLKAFAVIYIKKGYLNYIKHLDVQANYRNQIQVEENFAFDVFDSNLYALVEEAYKILPSKYAKVIELVTKGYKSNEIANMLGYNIQTVYNTKREAVNILKKHLSNKSFLTILQLLSTIP